MALAGILPSNSWVVRSMPTQGIAVIDAGPHQVSRRTVIDAPAATLFAMVADPKRHGELDGSGTVKDTVAGPDRLSKGAKFSVKMRMFGAPYRITSTVVGFEDNRLVEWQHPLGHKWRWEFEPVPAGDTGSEPGDGSDGSDGSDGKVAQRPQTSVTETWDYTGSGLRTRLQQMMGFPDRNAAGIESTLAALRSRYSDGPAARR